MWCGFGAWFLETYARYHTCAKCATMLSVGVDNKVGAAAGTCATSEGNVHTYTETEISMEYGCTKQRKKGSLTARIAMERVRHTSNASRREKLLARAARNSNRVNWIRSGGIAAMFVQQI